MSNVLVNEEYLSDIADAIRAKNGLSTTYKPSQMADAIDNIQTGGTSGLYECPGSYDGVSGVATILEITYES